MNVLEDYSDLLYITHDGHILPSPAQSFQRYRDLGEYGNYQSTHEHYLSSYFLDQITVNVVTGCWEWKGDLDERGVPVHWGDRAILVASSRMNGPIPEGYDVVSICGSQRCVWWEFHAERRRVS